MEFLPLAITVLSILGAVGLYAFQKAADRRNQILQERRELYRRFVSLLETTVIHLRVEQNDLAFEGVMEYKSVLAQLLVTAPDHVVGALQKMDTGFVQYLAILRKIAASETSDDGAQNSEVQETAFREAFDNVVLEMRLDSFEKTLVTREAIESILTKSLASSLGSLFK